MKILAIDGSPRKGNTDFMLQTILDSARENGAETDIIFLRDKKIGFCDGCEHCKKTKECHIKDEMPEIYKKLESSDIIILASPCYFFNVTAIMKNFMDRCNPYWFSKKLKGKKAFLVSVGGSFEESIKDTIRAMENFLRGIFAEKIGSYYTKAENAGEIKENPKVIKELQNIGKDLINK